VFDATRNAAYTGKHILYQRDRSVKKSQITVFVAFFMMVAIGLIAYANRKYELNIGTLVDELMQAYPVDANLRAVIFQGSDLPTTYGSHIIDSIFLEQAIPQLVIYDNGLVVFSCETADWPPICISHLTEERVEKLIDDLKNTGILTWAPPERVPELGPSSSETLIIRTPQLYSPHRWITANRASPVLYGPNPLTDSLQLIKKFVEEARGVVQHFEPDLVALTLKERCTSRDYLPQTVCTNLEAWPFDFSPPYDTMENLNCERGLEIPQPFTKINLAIPSLSGRALHMFQDGNRVVQIEIRPYLPGEKVRVACSDDRWDFMYPIYDSLPLYPIATPTP
jgi:hypothetical protein